MTKHKRHSWGTWTLMFAIERGRTKAEYQRPCLKPHCDAYQATKEMRPVKPKVKRNR